MTARVLLGASSLGLLLVACEPSPESFTLGAKSSHPITRGESTSTTTMLEGDVLVIDTNPLDDDLDRMDLCVTAASSNPTVVEARRATGKCRTFVLSATASGNATVTFRARDGVESLTITVTPLP